MLKGTIEISSKKIIYIFRQLPMANQENNGFITKSFAISSQ